MKKLCLISMIISIVLISPLLAADKDSKKKNSPLNFEISGEFFASGSLLSNANKNLAEESSSDAYYEFRLRPEFNIKVNENVKINSRVVIFDEIYGKSSKGRYVDDTTEGKSDVADWDRAWVNFNTKYGELDIGRMSGGLFGLKLFETERESDRIKYTLHLNDLKFFGIFEKFEEETPTNSESDVDKDAYYLAGVYEKESVEAGLMVGYVYNRDGFKTKTTEVNPYFKANDKGPIGIKGELKYIKSDKIPDDDICEKEREINTYGYHLALTGKIGAFNMEIGWAYSKGDNNVKDEEIRSAGATGIPNSGLGDEWVPFLILQDINALLDNVNGTKSEWNTNTGAKILYISTDWNLNEDITLTALLGHASPDTNKVIDYDHVTNTYNKISNTKPFGQEINFKIQWKSKLGFTYSMSFGYFKTGEFFESLSQQDIEDTYTLFHKIKIDF